MWDSLNKWLTVGALLSTGLLTACLGNNASDKEKEVLVNPGELIDNESYWENFKVVTPVRNGLMNPYFDAEIDNDKNIHVVFYSLSKEAKTISDSLYDINYGIFNTTTQEFTLHPTASLAVSSLTNTDSLALARDEQGQLYVVYRGGKPKACQGGTVPADTMVSVFDGTKWTEYTGAIGFVERAAGSVLEDGHAGAFANIEVDSTGKLHITYQFSYEGCDISNSQFPDLFYVGKQYSQLANDQRSYSEQEEQVSGNIGSNGGFQNTTGDVSDIVLNENNEPLVFYYSKGTGANGFGLYMGYQFEADNWKFETIHDRCEVEDVAAGMAKNGDIHVAYIAKDTCDGIDGEWTLMHAYRSAATLETPEPIWQHNYIFKAPKVGGFGRHLGLVMNKNDLPQIAYYELENYGGAANDLQNLATVELTPQNGYLTKDVAQWDEIGKHNKMIKDQDGEVYILSYTPANGGSIHLFVEGVNGRLAD